MRQKIAGRLSHRLRLGYNRLAFDSETAFIHHRNDSWPTAQGPLSCYLSMQACGTQGRLVGSQPLLNLQSRGKLKQNQIRYLAAGAHSQVLAQRLAESGKRCTSTAPPRRRNRCWSRASAASEAALPREPSSRPYQMTSMVKLAAIVGMRTPSFGNGTAAPGLVKGGQPFSSVGVNARVTSVAVQVRVGAAVVVRGREPAVADVDGVLRAGQILRGGLGVLDELVGLRAARRCIPGDTGRTECRPKDKAVGQGVAEGYEVLTMKRQCRLVSGVLGSGAVVSASRKRMMVTFMVDRRSVEVGYLLQNVAWCIRSIQHDYYTDIVPFLSIYVFDFSRDGFASTFNHYRSSRRH